jgi:SAM-dependent methyltransferase
LGATGRAAKKDAAMSGNDVVIQAWNTVLYDKFVRFKHLLVDGLGPFSAEILRRRTYPPGARVLDVGCGFGDSTIGIARLVAPRGEAVGVDCAENFVRAAVQDAAQAGVANARFFRADVQTDDLQGPYDYAFARFGTMFFNMPGVALRNIRNALKPGGVLTQIVWRKREDNPWIHDAELNVRELVPVVAHEDTDQVHCGPGPFSMAGADMVSSLLLSAGYTGVAFERFDTDICIGRDLNDAVDFAMTLGPAGEIIRLAGAEGEYLKPKVAEVLRRTLARYARSDGVWAPSSTWFISARRAP